MSYLVWNPDSTLDKELITEKLTELDNNFYSPEFRGKNEAYEYGGLMCTFWNLISELARPPKAPTKDDIAMHTENEAELEKLFGKKVDYGQWLEAREIGIIMPPPKGRRGPGRRPTRLWEWISWC